MNFLLIAFIVAVLYRKTIGYNYLIDDFVKREGYYNFGIVPAPVQIYSMKPSTWYRYFMIGMHIVNCWIIYLLWGFYAALIFAVHPMSVWCVAWVTGNYYATAAYFTLVSYYILHQFPNVWGAIVAMPIFNAAINSTVCPLAFPFLAIFEPWLAPLFIMLFWFLKSDRWAEAMKVRQELYVNPIKFDWRRPILMTKVVARYTFEAIFPIKTAMFIKFGDLCRDDEAQYEEMHTPDWHFVASMALILSVFTLGWMVNPFAISWFFIIIALHSQFGLTGQFYAQRYLYLPMIGMCVVTASVASAIGIWILAPYIGYLLYKTYNFIPVFENMEKFLQNDIAQSPKYSMSLNNYAAHLSKLGRNDETEPLFLKAEKLNPNEWATQFNLAKLYILQRKRSKALKHLEKGLTCTKDPKVLKMFEEIKRKVLRRMEIDSEIQKIQP